LPISHASVLDIYRFPYYAYVRGGKTMYKRNLIILCLIIVSMFLGCSNESVKESNINGFLKGVYQVESTDEYEDMVNKVEEYLKTHEVEGIYVIEDEEIYEPFILKIDEYSTENAVLDLIANGYITRYYQQALKEKCQFIIKDVEMEHNQKENQVYYTITIEKRFDDNTTQLTEGKGIIRLDEKGYVGWFKIVKDLG
jgi:hypothetical protein